MSAPLLLAPTRKSLVADIPALGRQLADLAKASTSLKAVDFSRRYVWLQGNVSHIKSDDEITIDDDSGKILVTALRGIPGRLNVPVDFGNYLMVVGELNMEEGQSSVKAIKIQDLSHNSSLLKEMWPLEVAEQAALFRDSGHRQHTAGISAW